ncbi:uncharacterized protein K452DRAFT_354100 [Aplosporella prunicola CBS 121167]|uniref:Aminoglycoside phosphotransferase domain-containing protein n=1 Tax=Aplosporella prunicola CBS 121167 TaxID=1176127 RepID=A0A6A6AXV4_9PEZI|nr:uncharacterized protein K452DRAFT_354100 [Aplosporella prunicola CBS 121167]KAF2136078.1 hypothetical protein K452DRAFT_354100 [Aplosporella prunicola CBS 121167]
MNPTTDLSSLLEKYANLPSKRQKPVPNTSQTPLEKSTEAATSPSQVHIHLELAPEVSSADTLVSAPTFVSDLEQTLQKGTTLSQYGDRNIVQLNNKTIVKHGLGLDCDEAHVMNYIHQVSKDIPLPRPLGAISIDHHTYIFMTLLEGNSLDKFWSSLSKEQKSSVQRQLSATLEKLRSLPLPSTYFGGGNIPSCKDTRKFTRSSQSTIQNEADFNQFLLSGPIIRYSQTYIQFLGSLLRTDHRIVMTHGDLHPRNIMVKIGTNGLVEVTGVVDWELGGAYPEYWEYVKALNTVSPIEEDDWSLYLPTKAIGEYGGDYCIDRLVGQLFC